MSKQSKAGMFLLGGILGAAAGLLFAPKKGVELRENLFEKTMDNQRKCWSKIHITNSIY